MRTQRGVYEDIEEVKNTGVSRLSLRNNARDE